MAAFYAGTSFWKCKCRNDLLYTYQLKNYYKNKNAAQLGCR